MKFVEVTPGFFSFIDSQLSAKNPEVLLIEVGSAPKDAAGVFVTAESDGQKFSEILAGQDLPNLFQRTSPFFNEDLGAYCQIRSNDSVLFKEEGCSLLDSCTRVGSYQFNASQGKAELMEGIMNTLSTHSIRSSIADVIVAVAEELFMNAAYDAPKELKGPVDTSLLSCMHVDLNEQRLQLTCVDPYGSLRVNKFIDRVKAVYRQGPRDAINWGEGGAGLGSTILVEKCSRIFMGVDQGKKTVVSCAIPIKLNLRQQLQMGRCFFAFEKKISE